MLTGQVAWHGSCIARSSLLAGLPGLLAVLVAGAACETRMEAPEGVVPADQLVDETREWADPSRPTPAGGAFPAAGSRELETRLWFAVEPPTGTPACVGRRCRAVVLAHGLAGNPGRLSSLARALARAGYIVAAPRFPLTNEEAPGGPQAGWDDVRQQPGDISFVIEEILAADRRPDDPLFGRVQPAPVGVVGHSLGGSTAIALSRLACCKDPRAGAVVLVAPSVADVGRFGEGISAEGPPTLLIHGTRDDIVDISESRDFYAGIGAPRHLVELARAGHADLIEDGGAPVGASAHVIVSFFDATLGERHEALPRTLDALERRGHSIQSHRG